MDKIRVLHAAKYYPPQYFGGIETAVEAMCKGNRDNDRFEITTLISQIKGKREYKKVDGMTLVAAAAHGQLASTPMAPDYVRLLRSLSRKADIVHVHLPNPLADVALKMSGFKGKVVISWHSDIVKQKTLKKFYGPLQTSLLKRADKIIVAAQGVLDNSEDLAPFRDKCVIIPYCVPEDVDKRATRYFKELEAENPSAADPDKVTENQPLKLIAVGRLVYYKGFTVLLKAMAKTKNPATLRIVGVGALEEELKAEAAELGLGDRVEFCGRLSPDELEKAYEESDVFAFPSIFKSEAYGIVQMEAMAYGKPVINTNLPSGVPSVSLDGITGLTVEPEDVEGLASAIDKLAEDPELREKFGKAARQRCQEEYREEIMVGRVNALYEELMKD